MTDALTTRLAAVLDHIGADGVHLAAQFPDQIAGFVPAWPDRVRGVLILEAIGLDPEPFQPVADRLTIVAGDGGMSAKVADAAHPRLPGARRVLLTGYGQPIWADSVSDHTDAVVAALRAMRQEGPICRRRGDGEHEDISYEILGDGPPLVLMPMFLSAAQWSAAIPTLARDFTLVVLGGRHLGGAAILEDRAESPSYAGMVRTMLSSIAPAEGSKVLEVGAGSGAVSRIVARHLPEGASLQAVDINGYLLREARALARRAGLDDRISFSHGDAEHLPFTDATFDHALSVTVLEECDADAALAELFRVVRPGGRVGIIVRGIDLPHPWNIDLPPDLAAKIDAAPPLVGPRGVADRSLYRRMRAVGFTDLVGMPMLASFNGIGGPIWSYFESRVLARLTDAERAVFTEALAKARAAGTLFCTGPHHCAVGAKPA